MVAITRKKEADKEKMASFGGIVVADPSLAAHFTQAELRSLKSQVFFVSSSLIRT